MRLAVLADVHGNALAFEAVRRDILSAAPDLIVDLGDRLSGPLWPADAAQIFDDLRPRGVRGNHDRVLGTAPREAMGPSDAFAFDDTGPEARAALAALPESLRPCEGVLAFHASPGNDSAYLHNLVAQGRLADKAPDEIDAAPFAGLALALCGHSHRPYVGRLDNGCLLVNPGSVGCPAYDDDGHVSESGAPHARWALVELGKDGATRFELRAVAYDFETAARRAERSGRPEWAFALRTGRSPLAPRR
jgi:predicted phosphodiesterase